MRMRPAWVHVPTSDQMPEDLLSSSVSLGGLICELAGCGGELPSAFRVVMRAEGQAHSRRLAGCSQPVGVGTPSSRGFPGGSGSKESACNAGEPGSVPGWGRSSGGGNGNPLQYSCLENSMDREAWRAIAIVRSVPKSWTRLSTSTTIKIFKDIMPSHHCALNRLQYSENSRPLSRHH